MATQRTVDGLKECVRLLRGAGWTVKLVSGWTSRGKGDMHVRGTVNHHDASSERSGNEGALRIVVHGREGLRNSLSAWHHGRDGTIWLVAAGRSWHAGYGSWRDESDLNTYTAGKEQANNGVGEPWGERLKLSAVAVDVVMARVFGFDVDWIPEHRQVDPDRKIDRNIPHDPHRRQVARHLRDGTIPSPGGTTTSSATTGEIVGLPITRGDEGHDVRYIQVLLRQRAGRDAVSLDQKYGRNVATVVGKVLEWDHGHDGSPVDRIGGVRFRQLQISARRAEDEGHWARGKSHPKGKHSHSAGEIDDLPPAGGAGGDWAEKGHEHEVSGTAK